MSWNLNKPKVNFDSESMKDYVKEHCIQPSLEFLPSPSTFLSVDCLPTDCDKIYSCNKAIEVSQIQNLKAIFQWLSKVIMQLQLLGLMIS